MTYLMSIVDEFYLYNDEVSLVMCNSL